MKKIMKLEIIMLPHHNNQDKTDPLKIIIIDKIKITIQVIIKKTIQLNIKIIIKEILSQIVILEKMVTSKTKITHLIKLINS